MPDKVVYIEPSDNFIEYASILASRLLESRDAVEIKGYDARPENVKEVIEREQPDMVWGVGHGQSNEYTTQSLATFLRTGKEPLNLDVTDDRIVHLLSCLTAKELGPDLINSGTDVYIGYNKEFYLGIKARDEPYPIEGSEPTEKQDFVTNTLCDLEAQRVLLDGGTVVEAYHASQQRFDEEIERYEGGDRSDWYIAPVMARALFHNKSIQRVEGVSVGGQVWQDVGVSTENIIKIGIPAGLISIGIGLTAMTLMGKK